MYVVFCISIQKCKDCQTMQTLYKLISNFYQTRFELMLVNIRKNQISTLSKNFCLNCDLSDCTFVV